VWSRPHWPALRQPTDQFYGDRRYGVTDLEGHLWWFATHLREVSTEDMQAVTGQ
jgi:hypothetical protein